DALAERLAAYEFERVGMVGSPGEFSVRGMILDVFPFSEEFPYRIEMSGDAIESIRLFDPGNQRSLEEFESVAVPLVSRSRLFLPGPAPSAPSVLDYLESTALVALRAPLEIAARVERLAAEEGMEGLDGRHAALRERLASRLTLHVSASPVLTTPLAA